MVGYDSQRAELEAAGVEVFAASVDPQDKAKEIADQVYFRVGFGVTRAQAQALDAWWEERRQIIQPTEFVLAPDGKVIASTYSDGPLGRIDATDVVKFAAFHASRP